MTFFDRLPAYILNRSPRILAAFDTDFLRNLDAFRRSIPRGEAFTLLVQIGWSVLVPWFAEELKTRMAQARELFPEARIIFLANEKEALEILKDSAECVWCHQNAFLDPACYPLAADRRRFDAIYVARITPFKRHALAAKIRNLHLVGSYSAREEEYFREIMRTVPCARWEQKVGARLVGRRMADASCGLALSAVEGAMFACGEYSLCGIPVVSTKNIGGRDLMLPAFSVYRADDTGDSVAEGVEHWKANPVPPQEIRAEFLRLAAPHRACLDDLIASIAGRRVKIPHKLGVRCGLSPLRQLAHCMLRRD